MAVDDEARQEVKEEEQQTGGGGSEKKFNTPVIVVSAFSLSIILMMGLFLFLDRRNAAAQQKEGEIQEDTRSVEEIIQDELDPWTDWAFEGVRVPLGTDKHGRSPKLSADYILRVSKEFLNILSEDAKKILETEIESYITATIINLNNEGALDDLSTTTPVIEKKLLRGLMSLRNRVELPLPFDDDNLKNVRVLKLQISSF